MKVDPKLALFSAHGVTQRTLTTWDNTLSRDVRVLVPVQLDALVVRANAVGGQTWADCKFRGGATTAAVLPQPFADRAPRSPGVYLRWALPDALTHITGTESGGVLPRLPDRWLIVRLSPGSLRRSVSAWVMETGPTPSGKIELASWVANRRADTEKGVNALGTGDPAWSAYFDNVVDRFGFYDDLDGVKAGPLSYLVCGWYSAEEDDPLADPTIQSYAAFVARLKSLQWQVSGLDDARERHVQLEGLASSGAYSREVAYVASTTKQPMMRAGEFSAALDVEGRPIAGHYLQAERWWPRQTLYHGSAVAIGWPDAEWTEHGLSGEVSGPPDPNSIKVWLGETPTEALAAVVGDGDVDRTRLLEAFLLGALSDLSEPDGPARIDDRLHDATFAALPTGARSETIQQVADPRPYHVPAPPADVEPGIFDAPSPAARNRHKVRATIRKKKKVSLDPVLEVRPGRLEEMRALLVDDFPVDPAAAVRTPIDVQRALPRLFKPADPVLLLRGARRAFSHNADGRYNADGTLGCRLSGQCVTEVAPLVGTQRYGVRGDQILAHALDHGGVPLECNELLAELAVLDPGSATTIAAFHPGVASELRVNAMVEQTAWWAMRDSRLQPAGVLAHSGLRGQLPSPVALSPPSRPWIPIHLDWRVAYLPSASGPRDWEAGEIDFVVKSQSVSAESVVLDGRVLLSAGIATATAKSIRKALNDTLCAGGTEQLRPREVEALASNKAHEYITQRARSHAEDLATSARAQTRDRADLLDVAQALEDMDILVGALDDFHTRLRGGIPGDGETVAAMPPNLFVPMRAGQLQVLRLRLVDAFGQVLDLCGSSASAEADPKTVGVSSPMSIASAPGHAALPPRFTAPARVLLRWVDANGTGVDATPTISPVCGWILPDHLDGALEVFDGDGAALGQVRLDADMGAIWEVAPGRASTLGGRPSHNVDNPFLAGIADALLDWGVADATNQLGVETALSALLRIIDSTLWAVDPFGHVGEEHLSVLLGHPVAVLRASLTLQVEEKVADAGLDSLRLPVRLGALTHWQDGLFAYFVDDNYRAVRCANSAVASFAREVGPRRGFLGPINDVTNYYLHFADDLGIGKQPSNPVTHPYIDDSGILWVVPNHEYALTLLVEPHTLVHATTCLLPRKSIGLRREWIAPPLARIAPTFRFGPVLIDPRRVRMPVATNLLGSWTWSHRADVNRWQEDSVAADSGDAILSPDPVTGQEGWLRLTLGDKGSTS